MVAVTKASEVVTSNKSNSIAVQLCLEREWGEEEYNGWIIRVMDTLKHVKYIVNYLEWVSDV